MERLNTDDECEYWKVILSQITFSGLSFVLGVQLDEDEFDEDDEDDEDDENDEEDEEDDEDELELEPAKLGAKRPAAGLPKVVDKKAKTETPNKPGHPCFPYFCLQMVKVSFENNFMSQR
jgi:hypothetical protein